MNQRRSLTRPRRGVAYQLRAVLILLLSLAVALSALPPPPGQAAGATIPSVTARLATYLTRLTAQRSFSGVVLIARRGTVLLSKGYGMADSAHNVANTPRTTFPTFSINATFSAIALLQLQEKGKLAVRDHICTYLAHCPATWRSITIHQLLSYTSGIDSYDLVKELGPSVAPLSMQQGLAACMALPLATPPGTQRVASLCDGLVAGLIVEKVAATSWATYLQTHIFGPLGMASSGGLTGEHRPPHYAQGYHGRAPAPAVDYNSFPFAYATAEDIYRYDQAMATTTLLTTRSRDAIMTPWVAYQDGAYPTMHLHEGYFWSLGTRADGRRALFTTSGNGGFSVFNMILPQDDVTVIVLSNDDANVASIGMDLTKIVLGGTIAAPLIPAHAVAPATAVTATFAGHGTVGFFPFALTSGAIWFPTQSPNGYLGTVTRVDTRTGKVVATIDVSAPAQAGPEQGEGAVAAAHGQVWAVASAAQTLARIDPATNKVVATIPLGIPAAGLAIAGNTLWATADPALGDSIVRVDLRTQKVVAVIRKAGHPYIASVATPDALWYVALDTQRVVRLDAATNRVVATISAGPVPQTVFTGNGSVWVGDATGALVTRIDPRTNRVVASIKTEGYPGNRQPSVDNCACRYAAGVGSVWVIANNTTLLRIDPQTNRPVASLTFNTAVGSIAVSDGSVWVATDGGNPAYTFYRVNPQTMQ